MPGNLVKQYGDRRSVVRQCQPGDKPIRRATVLDFGMGAELDGDKRARAQEEGFWTHNALRLTRFAGLVIDTHVPEGPLIQVVLDGSVPVFVYPVLRCGACAGRPLWPCQLLAWARDWVESLHSIVDVLDSRSDAIDSCR